MAGGLKSHPCALPSLLGWTLGTARSGAPRSGPASKLQSLACTPGEVCHVPAPGSEVSISQQNLGVP